LVDPGSAPNTAEEWLSLLQKQEMVHQMELEKWHEMLGAATELLRKTEQSLSNLQRSIHPLTLQKLRGILHLQQEQQQRQKEAEEAAAKKSEEEQTVKVEQPQRTQQQQQQQVPNQQQAQQPQEL
jgi:hypothetical protein